MFGKVHEDSFQDIFDLSLDNVIGTSGNGGEQFPSIGNRSGNSGLDDSIVVALLSSALSHDNTGGPWNDPWGSSSSSSHDNSNAKENRQPNYNQNNRTYASLFNSNHLERLQKLSPSLTDCSSSSSSSSSSGSSSSSSSSNSNYNRTVGSRNSNISCSSSTISSCSSSTAGSCSSSIVGSFSSSKTDNSKTNGDSRGNSSNRYKTELCRPFQEHGTCKYGDKCQFAHGTMELRNVARHPKYKTDLCRTYHSTGFCPYGPRCHFVHNPEEISSHQQQKQQQSPPVQLPMAVARPPPSCSPMSSTSSTASKDESYEVRPLPMFSPKHGLHDEEDDLSSLEFLRLTGSHQMDVSARSSPSRLPVFSTLFH